MGPSITNPSTGLRTSMQPGDRWVTDCQENPKLV
ncbi:MAG: hypothetical protein V3S14_14265 [Anaerolineae bacterium]